MLPSVIVPYKGFVDWKLLEFSASVASPTLGLGQKMTEE